MVRSTLLSLTALALLSALPAPAQAAEGFAGVTESGALVSFTSANPFALTTPRVPRGLVDGERLVALSDSAAGLVAVGSSARLYAIASDFSRARPIGAPFGQGLRGVRFSLAAAPDATTGRLLSDVGQDLVLDLRTGAAQDGPGLRRADDARAIAPAADVRPDGRLLGVALPGPTVFDETAAGSATFGARTLETPSLADDRSRLADLLREPIAVSLGQDRRGYLLAVDADGRRNRQSVLLGFDPDRAQLTDLRLGVQYFGRRLVTFASTGTAAADRTAPRVQVSYPRQVSVRALLAHRFPVLVRSSEASPQTLVVLRRPGRGVLFTSLSRDTPGSMRLEQRFVTINNRNALRRAIGKRITLAINVKDGAGNKRLITRSLPIVP